MDKYEFTYELPRNFHSRVIQYLKQFGGENISVAFQQSEYEYTVLGYAYNEQIKGDVWNKKAVDFTIEGTKKNISILQTKDTILKRAIGMALKPNESGYLVKNIYYLENDELSVEECMPESNEKRLEKDISEANKILNDIIKVGEKVCINHSYNATTHENIINDAFRDMLSTQGYEVKDQTRHGVSGAGKDAALLDILLTKDGKEIAIFEALRLKGVDKSTISGHISKAITNYNALGTPTFIVVYYYSHNFDVFWNNFYEYISEFEYPFPVIKPIQELPHPNASARVATMVISKDGYDFPVYFTAFKIV